MTSTLLLTRKGKRPVLVEPIPGYRQIKYYEIRNCLYGDVEEAKQLLSQITLVLNGTSGTFLDTRILSPFT